MVTVADALVTLPAAFDTMTEILAPLSPLSKSLLYVEDVAPGITELL